MDKIVLLDEALINKIAAGEVIERPASVVKELIENSLDAGAKKIIIDVKEGGKSYIKITDDGFGMSQRDANLSWQRHATSKIKNDVDLYSIKTFGFRGEALASIAAVSEMTIITKEEEPISGIKIVIKGGKKISEEIIGCPNGTTIEVKNLFFNTPARKKFLKSIETELSQIIDIVTRYALIHNNIHFILYHNGKEILNSPGTNDMLTNISYVYGQTIVKELIEVNYIDENFKVRGFISLPTLTRSNKEEQSIYVNGRYIKKNKIISDAIEDAYKTYVMINRYPIVILNIEIPFEKTDVNVHPQKSEIKIQDEALLYTAVFKAIRETLEKNKVIAEAHPEIKKKISEFVLLNLPENDDKKNLETKEAKSKGYLVEDIKQELLIKEDEELKIKNLPEMKILGILNKTFILAEMQGGLIIIDQHAAAERILYEKYTQELKNKQVNIQELLNPEILELSAKNYHLALSKKDIFKELGYTIDDFGHNSIIIRSIPIIFGRQFSRELFLDFLAELKNEKLESLEKIFHEKIAKMACRTAIKAGDEITIPQIKQYIQELGEQYLPYTCPHGRPIMIKFSIYELEKMFKRIV